MDYEDFVIQFRARAAARLEEFEKALAKAQKDTAAAVKTTQVPPAESAEKRVNHKTQAAPVVKKPVQPARGRARGRGPVQSVLREA